MPNPIALAPARAAHEAGAIWDRFVAFESLHGDLAGVVRVEARRAQVQQQLREEAQAKTNKGAAVPAGNEAHTMDHLMVRPASLGVLWALCVCVCEFVLLHASRHTRLVHLTLWVAALQARFRFRELLPCPRNHAYLFDKVPM